MDLINATESSMEEEDISDIEDSLEDDLDAETQPCEAFEQYEPAFVKFGKPHPTPLCEGASLACVAPPEVTYQLAMDAKHYEPGHPNSPKLSNAQLEAVLYASQSFEQFFAIRGKRYRQGFYLGDGCGVGKTLTLAATLYELRAKHGVKTIVWFSPSPDLIGIVRDELGVFDPDLKVYRPADCKTDEPLPEGVLFMTYTMLSYTAQQKKLKLLLKDDFDGLLIFDEAHFAKNVKSQKKPSGIGRTVLDLQETFPNARVMYASATCASEPHHLAYMQRLKLWGEETNFKTDQAFRAEMDSLYANKEGIAAMELLCMDMKRRGVFVSRLISFNGVSVNVIKNTWRPEFVEIYNRCCALWMVMLMYSYKTLDGLSNEEKMGRMSTFYASIVKFFGSLITSYKLGAMERQIFKDLKRNKSVVIGLQFTGESRFNDWITRKHNKGRPHSNTAEILRRQLEVLGIYVGCPKVYLKHGNQMKTVGDWVREDDEACKAQAAKSIGLRRKKSKQSSTDHDEDADFLEDEDLGMFSEEENEDFDAPDATAAPSCKRKRTSVVENKQTSGAGSSVAANRNPTRSTYTEMLAKISGFTIKDLIQPLGSPEEPVEAATDGATANLAGFPKYSVGTYGIVKTPDAMTWSIEDAKRSLDPELISRAFHELVPLLPINPLDELLERIKVAAKKAGISKQRSTELISNCTGRSSLHVYDESAGKWVVESTGPREGEIEKFNNLQTRVVIVSNAASVGVSLHPRAGIRNQQVRSHLTLEYSFSPDKVSQQLGRTQRAEQLHKPQYHLVESGVPAGARFEAIVARRLVQLGALCQGQGRSSILASKLSNSLCSDVAVKAINRTIEELQSIPRFRMIFNLFSIKPLLAKKRHSAVIVKYTSNIFNRLLICPIEMQKKMCESITKHFAELIDGGHKMYGPIIDYPHPDYNFRAELLGTEYFELRHGPVELHTFKLSRVLFWGELQRMIEEKGFVGTYYSSPYLGVFFSIESQQECGTENTKKSLLCPFSGDPITPKWTTFPTHCNSTGRYFAESKWDDLAQALDKDPICYCRAMGDCDRRNCRRYYGSMHLRVLCGNSYGLLFHLGHSLRESLQIVRVKHNTNNQAQINIGVLIKEEQVEDLLRKIRGQQALMA